MEANEILEHLRHGRGAVARQAVTAAVERREEVTPHLLALVEDAIERAEEIARDPRHSAHLYALALLHLTRYRVPTGGSGRGSR
jgi:hypothetical protein